VTHGIGEVIEIIISLDCNLLAMHYSHWSCSIFVKAWCSEKFVYCYFGVGYGIEFGTRL